MVLEWREREHEEDNAMAENHPPTIVSLRDCGLFKYFHILGMRAQVRLLEYLVRCYRYELTERGGESVSVDY
jgi:hypothetical protein